MIDKVSGFVIDYSYPQGSEDWWVRRDEGKAFVLTVEELTVDKGRFPCSVPYGRTSSGQTVPLDEVMFICPYRRWSISDGRNQSAVGSIMRQHTTQIHGDRLADLPDSLIDGKKFKD